MNQTFFNLYGSSYDIRILVIQYSRRKDGVMKDKLLTSSLFVIYSCGVEVSIIWCVLCVFVDCVNTCMHLYGIV
jgi:hypothetical protein